MCKLQHQIYNTILGKMSTIVNEIRSDTLKDRTTNDEESDTNSLFKSIVPILILVKIIGLFPVQGITGKNSKNLV